MIPLGLLLEHTFKNVHQIRLFSYLRASNVDTWDKAQALRLLSLHPPLGTPPGHCVLCSDSVVQAFQHSAHITFPSAQGHCTHCSFCLEHDAFSMHWKLPNHSSEGVSNVASTFIGKPPRHHRLGSFLQ